MIRLREGIGIRRPPDAVYDLLTDFPRYPQLLVGVVRWRPADGSGGRDGAGVGARFDARLQIGSVPAGGIVRITRLESPALVAWTSEAGVDHDARFVITPDGRGSDLTWELDLELPGRVVSWFTERLAGKMLRRRMVATLETIRHHLEHEST